MHTISVGDCIRYGWETFKQRPWILIGGLLLAVIVAGLPNLLGPYPHIGPDGQVVPPEPSVYGFITNLISVFVSIGVSLGVTTFALRAHDDINALQIGDLWNPGAYWRYFGTHILTFIIIALGFMALVVPGVILAAGLAFTPFLVIDRGLGPIDAIKESWRLTKGHKGRILLLFLALIGILMLGALVFGVGLLVAIPIAIVAMAHAYRTLSN
jgi:uncharacterized membrane protein